MSYLIKKDHKTSTILYMKYQLDGYKFKPKNKTKVKVNQITVVNCNMIDEILTIKFKEMLKGLSAFIMNMLYSDDNDSSSDVAFALSEIDRLREIINGKYNQIAKEKKEFFLQELKNLEKQLQIKELLQVQYQNLYEEEVKEVAEQSRGGR